MIKDLLFLVICAVGGFFLSSLLIFLITGENIFRENKKEPQRMMCVTLNYEKGGFLKTMVWDSHNMAIQNSGNITSPEGAYNTFPGELCLIAPLTNSRGPKP